MEDGYGIGIADEFVRQLSKTRSIQYRSCTTERNGPGGS
jgi:Rod binding domain-containing protein